MSAVDSLVSDITHEEFEQQVLKSEKPVLVDFWAEWCGPCRMLSPIMDQISLEKSDKLKIVKINIDDNVSTSTEFRVRSLPTMILFDKGVQVASKIGASTKEDLLKWIESEVEC